MTSEVRRKISLNADSVKTILQLNQPTDIHWDETVNALIDCYREFATSLLPDMTPKEAKTLIACYKELDLETSLMRLEAATMHIHVGEMLSISTPIARLLCDSEEEFKDEVANKDRAVDFYAKVKRWSLPQRLAALHFALKER